MQDIVVAETRPLSQVERVVDTFIAPSKTFTDILRSTSWWLPFILFAIVSVASTFVVGKKVGFEAVAQRQVELNPRQEEQMSTLPAEQRAKQLHMQAIVTEIIGYGFSVAILIGCAFIALLYWASFNFGLGAKTTYGQMFALCVYATLPRLFLSVLNIVFLFAGVNVENYDIRNPVGTNLAYYMPDVSPALKPILQVFDLFGLWSLVLTVIGAAIISRKSVGQSAAVVVGWTVLFTLIATGFAAAFG